MRLNRLTEITALCAMAVALLALYFAVNTPTSSQSASSNEGTSMYIQCIGLAYGGSENVVPNPQNPAYCGPDEMSPPVLHADGGTMPPPPMPNTFLPVDHIVRQGDSLWDFSYLMYGDGSKWTRFSRSITGPDDTVILVPITDPYQLQIGWDITDRRSH